MNEKKHGWAPRLISALFLISFVLTGVGIFLFQRKTSETENRVLQTLPKPDGDSVLSGEWQEKFETFTSDQFPFRDTFNAVGVTVRYALGSRLIGGSYIGRAPDGSVRLFEGTEADPERADRVEKTLGAIDALAGTDIDTVLLAVPSSGSVFTEDMPAFAPAPDTEINAALAKDHNFTIVKPDFPSDESLYFRTDHHWTARGAELAYRAYASAMGLTPVDTSFRTVGDGFFGTLHSKAPLPFITPDILEASTLDVSGVTVRQGGGYGGTDSLSEIPLYHEDALTKKDKYQYFLGGNYGLVVIENDSAEDGTLFIFKDSFANCFVPYLTSHYSRIFMVDPRYYRGSSADLKSLFGEADPDTVLILYESSTLADDTYLSSALSGIVSE